MSATETAVRRRNSTCLDIGAGRVPRNLSSRLTRMRHPLATPSHVSPKPRSESPLSIRPDVIFHAPLCARQPIGKPVTGSNGTRHCLQRLRRGERSNSKALCGIRHAVLPHDAKPSPHCPDIITLMSAAPDCRPYQYGTLGSLATIQQSHGGKITHDLNFV